MQRIRTWWRLRKYDRQIRREAYEAIASQHYVSQRISVTEPIPHPPELTSALRELRKAAADVRALCEIAARVLENHLDDDQLPADRLAARRGNGR